jgi:chromosome segregation ATPase
VADLIPLELPALWWTVLTAGFWMVVWVVVGAALAGFYFDVIFRKRQERDLEDQRTAIEAKHRKGRNDLQRRLDVEVAKNRVLSADLAEVTASCLENGFQCARSEADSAAAATREQDLQRDLQAALARQAALEAEVGSLRHRLGEATGRLRQLESQASGRTDERRQPKDSPGVAVPELRRSKEQLAEERARRVRSQQELADLRCELGRKQAKIDDLALDLARQKEETNRLRTRREDAEQLCQTLRGEADRHAAGAHTLSKELEGYVNTHAEEVAELKREHAKELDRQKATQEDGLTRLRNQVAGLQEANEGLRRRLAFKGQEVRKWKDRCREVTANGNVPVPVPARPVKRRPPRRQLEARFGQALRHLLPNIDLARDSAETLLSFPDAARVFKALRLLDVDPDGAPSERAEGSGGWMEYRFGTGGSHQGERMYFHRSDDTGRYAVLVSTKPRQNQDMAWMKSQPG